MELVNRPHEALTNSSIAPLGIAQARCIPTETRLPKRSPSQDESSDSSDFVVSSTTSTRDTAAPRGSSPDASGKEERRRNSEEDEDEGIPGLFQLGGHKEQRKIAAPNRRISPFDVRFSQGRMRSEFRCGRSVEETVAAIRAVREDAPGGEPAWRLEAPFPTIEVIPWRCKLRDESGRPIVDEQTGGELWDSQDHIFTLDNRRLYCFQKAAAALWPQQVGIDVVELPPQSLTRLRQVRKFRTPDSGMSISVGSRTDTDSLVHWSWRSAVGVAESREAVCRNEDCLVQTRRRPRGEHRQLRRTGSGSQYKRAHGRHTKKMQEEDADAAEEHPGLLSRPLVALMLFLAIHATLKVARAVGAHFSKPLPVPEVQATDDALMPPKLSKVLSTYEDAAWGNGTDAVEGSMSRAGILQGDESTPHLVPIAAQFQSGTELPNYDDGLVTAGEATSLGGHAVNAAASMAHSISHFPR